jgi:RNA polymerase sigma-70 factor (ECF subfamily)
MYRIATNESITFLNRQRKKMTEPFDASITAHNAGLKADHYFDASQAEKLLVEALAILPDKQKEVFQLRYYGELTYKQMSDALGTSEGALKASFHHAVKKIEKYLIENGIA